MLGVLAAGAFTEINVKDVVAPVAAVCGATIAAITAWWNAHKTPSDRLQAFVAIYESWPDPLPGKAHIAELIRGQLGEMWHRYPHLNIGDAAMNPECTEAVIADDSLAITALAKRHFKLDVVAFVVSLVAVVVSACISWPIDQTRDVVLIVASLIGGFALVAAFAGGIRLVRHWV